MAIRFSDGLPRGLRFEPTPKRIRAFAAGRVLADTKAARLVWEPDRVVPIYAVPEEDLDFTLLQEESAGGDHTAPLARAWALAAPGGELRGHAAWSYADSDMEGYVALRWPACETWLEEEEEVYGHPRDPFHRVDMRASTRHIRVSTEDGTVLAESKRPLLVFETGLPVRHYLPREDVRMDLLTPTDRRTICAYKGFASYFRLPGGGENAWTYPDPLPDHPALKDLICFFGERLDIVVDGEQQERPATQWA